MKLVIDFDDILLYLEQLTQKTDFMALFFTVFIALGCFSAVSFTLKLLADKRIVFSFPSLILFAVSSAGLFGFAYLEYLSCAEVFSGIYHAALYGICEFIAITVLYAIFFGFAHKDSKQIDITAAECAPTFANAVKPIKNDDKRLYPIKTCKMNAKSCSEDFYVDFQGVYDFLNEIKESGKNVEEAARLERKIRFYDGLPINKGTLSVINNLFSTAVRLARDD